MSEDDFYRRALGRIYRNLFALAVGGALVGGVWQGVAAGAGFFAGAAAALGVFAWFHRLVEALGGETRRRGFRAMAWALGARYLLIGGAAYVMIKYLGINKVAFLVGLLVLAPAVLIEIITELIYARA